MKRAPGWSPMKEPSLCDRLTLLGAKLIIAAFLLVNILAPWCPALRFESEPTQCEDR